MISSASAVFFSSFDDDDDDDVSIYNFFYKIERERKKRDKEKGYYGILCITSSFDILFK
jgi:hypothetical protein